MSGKPPNDTWKQQNKRLVRATFKKAFITAIYASSSTVDVFFAENPQTVIRNIPIAGNVDPRLIMIGDRCRVDVFDETNPNDMVVAYVYGRSFKFTSVASKTFWNTGSGFVGAGGTNDFTLPHGLVDNNGNPVTPDFWDVRATGFPFYTPTNTTYLITSATADDTVLNFSRIPNNTISMNYIWWAVKIVP